MSKKTLLLIGGFVVLVGVFYAFTYKDIAQSAQPLPILGTPGHKVGPFAFVDQLGDTVTQNALNGKVSVVEYFYTTCPGICPRMNKNMDKVYEDLKNTPDFQILSNTVDPAHDSVPVLAKYAQQWNANPKVWKFLTGPRDELYDVALHQYLLSVADPKGVTAQFVHSQWFALVDQDRRVRGFYDGLKPANLQKMEKDIHQLLKED